jgi:subtilisin family serine protease
VRRVRSILTALLLTTGALAVPGTASAAEHSRYVVMLSESAGDPAATAVELGRRYGADDTHIWTAVEGYSAELTAAEAAAVAADPDVESVMKDTTFDRVAEDMTPVPCQELADPRVQQCLGENVDRVDGEHSTASSGDPAGAVATNIAVVDTGVDQSHPDLNVAGGVDCGTGQPVPGPGAFVDLAGHGTFVAGVAAARDNGEGIVGVAPGAPVWSVKVADADGMISDSSVLCAVDWILATMRDSDPTNDIAVANISLGDVRNVPDDGQCGLVNGDPLHLAFCRSVDAGTLWVAAAGNAAEDLAQTVPATYDEVLTATAMTDFDGRPGGLDAPDCFGLDLGEFGEQDDAAAAYSNVAVMPEDRAHTLSAPGTCVPSTVPLDFGGYAISSGTSFSAPLLSATAARCIDSGRCPTHSPRVTSALLMQDAAVYNSDHPEYGFAGDPLRPSPDPRALAVGAAGTASEPWYGYLVWAGHY